MSERSPRFSWGHINVNVRNLDRSVAFYQKLGFELLMPGIPYLDLDDGAEPRPLSDDAARALGVPVGIRGRACIMQLHEGFPKLDLTEWRGGDIQAEPPGNGDLGPVRLCLATGDLAAAVAELTAEGVEFLSAPTPGHEGLADIAVCKDPDGTLIELIQLHLERWSLPSSGA